MPHMYGGMTVELTNRGVPRSSKWRSSQNGKWRSSQNE